MGLATFTTVSSSFSRSIKFVERGTVASLPSGILCPLPQTRQRCRPYKVDTSVRKGRWRFFWSAKHVAHWPCILSRVRNQGDARELWNSTNRASVALLGPHVGPL